MLLSIPGWPPQGCQGHPGSDEGWWLQRWVKRRQKKSWKMGWVRGTQTWCAPSGKRGFALEGVCECWV